jgi:hypothetical protein
MPLIQRTSGTVNMGKELKYCTIGVKISRISSLVYLWGLRSHSTFNVNILPIGLVFFFSLIYFFLLLLNTAVFFL